MKISETAIQKLAGGSPRETNKANERNGSTKTCITPPEQPKTGSVKASARSKASKTPLADKPPKPASDGSKTKTSTTISAKKPWIPCTRRPSKPKPPPAILEMELSLVDPKTICKKYPKSSTPDSSDNDKAKKVASSPTDLTRVTTPSFNRRAKVALKRQFALDKAISNSKESISDDSLKSITSVTQLLKMERTAFELSNNSNNGKTNADPEDGEDVVFAGVKFLAARLQAKNASSNFTTVHSNDRSNQKLHTCSNEQRRDKLHSNEIPLLQSNLNKACGGKEVKKENIEAYLEAQLSTAETKIPPKFAVIAPTPASGTTERKIVNANKVSTAGAAASLLPNRASVLGTPRILSQPKVGLAQVEKEKTSELKPVIHIPSSSSLSPLKSSAAGKPITLPAASSEVKSTAKATKNNKKHPFKPNNKTDLTTVTVEATSLVKQTNHIKNLKVDESKSKVNKVNTVLNPVIECGQKNSKAKGNRITHRLPDKHQDGNPSSLVPERGTIGNTIASSNTAGARNKTTNNKVPKLETKCQLSTWNKVKRNSSNSEEEIFSSSSSSSSLPLLKASLQQRIIIPSIIMSEYVVEGDEGVKATAVVVNSQNLFIPLQFIEPLEPTCDILEGSCLELKVRIRGAETVVWVKENKIIPNAPPDFQYIEEKADCVYGLRIADVFLEDAGLYVCEAYGAGGSEITSWCEVDVIETGANDDDISWEDLDMSEEIKTPQPLVVPVIVTSQAEQEVEPSPAFQTAKSKETTPVRIVKVQQVDVQGHNNEVSMTDKIQTDLISVSAVDNCHHDALQHASEETSQSLDVNQEASPKRESTTMKPHSPSEVTSNYAETAIETVTDFASANAIKETRYTYPDEIKNDPVAATTVAVVVPAEVDQLVSDPDEAAGGSQQDHDTSRTAVENQRRLLSQLSSASDESVSLKETRSGDEGAHSSAEEMSASISLDVKSNIANDEDHTATLESLAGSPFSEQNGRSSSVDSAIGFLGRPLFSDGKFPPRILMGPSCVVALYGEVVHLRVKVQNYGIPKTTVNWFKFVNGTYKRIELNSGDQISSQGDAHLSITKCGTSLSTLSITHSNYDDCGRYRAKVQNSLGMDSHDCLLTVEGPPEAPTTPPKVKYDDKCKTILIQWSSCPYDGGSKITGYYVEASIIQGSRSAINKEDQDNWQLLTPQSYSWLCYTLTNPKRGSVYRFRVFGENSYGKGRPTEPSLPLLVPVLMEGRRAGSSDALLWSLKSFPEESSSLRADTNRKVVPEERSQLEDSGQSVQEEEPIIYTDVTIKHESFYDVYDKFDELGKGRFGIVFEVIKKDTKQSYAGKFVKCIKSKDKERVQLEVKIMNDLEYHPKLICLIDAFEMPREIVIVTQRINGGELFERVVADDFTLTEGDCITFLQQICDAVKYIHEKNIMHLDLKPENILCTSKDSNQIKIIDFGLAQYYDAKEPIRVLFGTAEFVSPEIINYEPIAPSTDNWSIGVITYILLSGLSPFMGDNDNETFSNITRAEFDFDDEAFEKISDDAKDFISNLIVKRPEKRMTSEQCLSHRWLKRESDNEKLDVILPTDKLKRFLVRRKWQKTGNAIRALGRITTLYSSRRSSSASSTPTGSLSLSSPPQSSFARNESLMTQDSTDSDVFYSQPSPVSTNKECCNTNSSSLDQPTCTVQLSATKSQPLINNYKQKHSDPCRSDSGVCDVGSFSSSINLE